MALTIFQYLPVLEEENGAPSTELSKKSDETNNSDDDNTADDDSTEDTDKQFSESFNFGFHKLITSHTFYVKNRMYKCPDHRVTTPPPKV